MNIAVIALLTAAAYLLGSIPCGLLLARARGVNIRQTGSGNIGATNVFRSVGPGAGVLTFAVDAAKGFIPAAAFPLLLADGGATGMLFGLAAICGHNFPVFLNFRGGKGVATGAGVVLALAPWAVLTGLLVWVLVLGLSGYVSLASICAAAAVALCSWWRPGMADPAVPATLTAVGALIVIRHRANIRRLLNGTENRFRGMRIFRGGS